VQAKDQIEAAIQRRKETFRLLHLEHRVDDYRVTFAEGSVHVTEGRVDEAAVEETLSPGPCSTRYAVCSLSRTKAAI